MVLYCSLFIFLLTGNKDCGVSNFRKNGFALEEDPDAPPGQHFKLKAVPFSKNITFGVEGNPCFVLLIQHFLE